jgi:hypothetical protein
MPADKAMMTKPVCGDDPSIDDQELAVAVDKDKEEPLAQHRRRCPRGLDAFGELQEVYQVVVTTMY